MKRGISLIILLLCALCLQYTGDHFPLSVCAGKESITGNGSIFNSAGQCQQKQNIMSI